MTKYAFGNIVHNSYKRLYHKTLEIAAVRMQEFEIIVKYCQNL